MYREYWFYWLAYIACHCNKPPEESLKIETKHLLRGVEVGNTQRKEKRMV